MGGSSNNNSNSFIPKRGTSTRPRRSASRQMYLFTLISYVVFFATMIAAVGVFLYDRYVDGQLKNEVSALNQEMERFRESDMNKVQAFNARLTQANSRIEKNVSLPAVFTALEASTAQTVKLAHLNLIRDNDERFILKTEIDTDTFDSSIFQRELLKSNELIAVAVVDDISISTGQADSESETSDQNTAAPGVSFSAELVIPISAVPFIPGAEAMVRETPPIIEPPATTTVFTEDDITETELLETDEAMIDSEEVDNQIQP